MSNAIRHISRMGPLAAAAAVAAVLAAGGADSPTSPVGLAASRTALASVAVVPGAHNAADVAFARRMITHHRQAVVMAEMAATRSHSPQVKALAAKIEAAQQAEIRQMSVWLRAWGQRVPAPGASGMMSSAEMAKMRAASGPAFDRVFLAMMIIHHEGAVRMAKTERLHGEYGPARSMAKSIITSQTAQIAQMKALLLKG
jgi:uncharacterized protein (DUF305 family)